MALFELTLVLLLIAVALTGLSRRLEIPYPSLLALAGAGLAFVPGAPTIEIDPELALALFIAPVLLDAAYRHIVAGPQPLSAAARGPGARRRHLHHRGRCFRRLENGRAADRRGDRARRHRRAAGCGGGERRARAVQGAAPHHRHPAGREPAQRCHRTPDLPAGGFGSARLDHAEQRHSDDLAVNDRQPGRGLCARPLLAADAQPDRGCGEQHGGAIRRNIRGLDPGRQARPFGHHHHRRLCHDPRAQGAAPHVGKTARQHLFGVGVGGLRAQRAGLRADGPAGTVDRRPACRGRAGRSIRLRRNGAGRRHRVPPRLGVGLRRDHAMVCPLRQRGPKARRAVVSRRPCSSAGAACAGW